MADAGTSDKLMVFDVWTSQAAFDKFSETLMPILQQLGVNPGQPSVMETAAAGPKKRARAKHAAPRRRMKKKR